MVRFDDIMDALKHLDGEAAQTPQYSKFINRARRLKELYHGERTPFYSAALRKRPTDRHV